MPHVRETRNGGAIARSEGSRTCVGWTQSMKESSFVGSEGLDAEEGELDDLLGRERDHGEVVVAREEGCCGRERDDVRRKGIGRDAEVESGDHLREEMDTPRDLE